MNSNLLQIYPTNCYVNQKRSNYAYGEIGYKILMSTKSKMETCSVNAFIDTISDPVSAKEIAYSIEQNLFACVTTSTLHYSKVFSFTGIEAKPKYKLVDTVPQLLIILKHDTP
ncbi:MAG TPA: hypothetical protein VJY41_08445 [Prolixibacteraceae bacterium]|nr:hypothetical protein [Prolixibacteraceae bacterium]